MLLSSAVRKLETTGRGTGNALLALDCDFCPSIMKNSMFCVRIRMKTRFPNRSRMKN